MTAPALRRAIVHALLLISCAGLAACSSCRTPKRKPPPADLSGADQDGPVPLPPTLALPHVEVRPTRNQADYALPAQCSFTQRVDTYAVAGKSIRLLAPRSARNEFALAHEPAEGLGPAPIRAIVETSTKHGMRDLPWFDLASPPLADQGDSGWLTAFDSEIQATRRQAVIAREGHPFERIAAGDDLRAIDLQCDGHLCALLTSRTGTVSGPGATLFTGDPSAPASTWARSDIDSPAADEIPARIVQLVAAENTARIALVGKSTTNFVLWRDGKLAREAAIPLEQGLIDAAYSGGEYVTVSNGAPVDERGCAPSGASLIIHRASRNATSVNITASPHKAKLLPMGDAQIFVWLAPVNCLLRDRMVAYAVVIDDAGIPQDSPMPVGDATDFAARMVDDTWELFLAAEDGVKHIRARCAVPSPK